MTYNTFIENEIIRNSIDKETIKSVRNPTKVSEFDTLTQVWFKKGIKPSYVVYYESGKVKSEFWYENKRKHRIDGPAVISYCEDGKFVYDQWWLNGNYIVDIKKWLKENYYSVPLTKEQQTELLLRFG